MKKICCDQKTRNKKTENWKLRTQTENSKLKNEKWKLKKKLKLIIWRIWSNANGNVWRHWMALYAKNFFLNDIVIWHNVCCCTFLSNIFILNVTLYICCKVTTKSKYKQQLKITDQIMCTIYYKDDILINNIYHHHQSSIQWQSVLEHI